ncbi:MAG: hypothetical protein ACI8RZ_003145 [Myxococcota bacterium]|jgi:hypothetical protein
MDAQAFLKKARKKREAENGAGVAGGLTFIVPTAQDEETLACPTCHTRFDYGMRCPDCQVMLVGVSFLTGPPPPPEVVEEHTGPRYACEKCGTRGDDDKTCVKCGHWEVLDLHRASDRRFDAVLKEQRRQRWRHAVTGVGVLGTLAGLVLLLLGTVYLAPPMLIIGLILTLGGITLAAGGPIDV